VSVELSPGGNLAAVQTQAYVSTLSKVLKVAETSAAQLLQSLPAVALGGDRVGAPVSGIGQRLDTFA
jgi:hypothetical protein